MNLEIRVLLDLLVLSTKLVHEVLRVPIDLNVLLEALVLKVELVPRVSLEKPAQLAFPVFPVLLVQRGKLVHEEKIEQLVLKVLLAHKVLLVTKES